MSTQIKGTEVKDQDSATLRLIKAEPKTLNYFPASRSLTITPADRTQATADQNRLLESSESGRPRRPDGDDDLPKANV